MPILVESSGESASLRLEGEVDIAAAAELKSRLLEVLGSAKEIRVDLGRAVDLDVTALQLLRAAERQAGQLRLRFSFENVREELSAAMASAGFAKF